MEKLAGKTTLITGGASGIGLGMARAFLAAGLQIAIADINEAALEAAEAALPGLGKAVKLDVTRAAEWERALDAVEAALGEVEILCNNAGVGQGRFADGREIRVAEMPEALWRMVLEINATGTFLGARAVVPRMLARGPWGHIVNTASTGEVIGAAGVAIDIVDVGGGFPVPYPDVELPPLAAFFAEIEAGFERIGLPNARLWAEPGRALVAGGSSVVVQVQARRGDALYVNDGVYGSLADAGALGFRYPVRCIRPVAEAPSGALHGFSFFGPTCDSADVMRGPFFLPADIGEGDWIEIGQLGAYGACLRTGFNGFDRARIIEVADPPLDMMPADIVPLPNPTLARIA